MQHKQSTKTPTSHPFTWTLWECMGVLWEFLVCSVIKINYAYFLLWNLNLDKILFECQHSVLFQMHLWAHTVQAYIISKALFARAAQSVSNFMLKLKYYEDWFFCVWDSGDYLDLSYSEVPLGDCTSKIYFYW